jgi:hypothetical protein
METLAINYFGARKELCHSNVRPAIRYVPDHALIPSERVESV